MNAAVNRNAFSPETWSAWDICMADMPFEDTPEVKRRPVLILAIQNDSVLVAKLTTHYPRRQDYDLQSWERAGLDKPTAVRMEQQRILPLHSIVRKIGHVSEYDIFRMRKMILAARK